MAGGRVTMTEMRELRYCAAGVRTWCREHGLDFRTLATEGIPFEQVEPIDDHFAQTALALARKHDNEDANGQR